MIRFHGVRQRVKDVRLKAQIRTRVVFGPVRYVGPMVSAYPEELDELDNKLHRLIDPRCVKGRGKN